MTSDLDTRLDLLRNITSKVGAFALARFGNLSHIVIETKGEADYVSAADRDAESLARRLIHASSPPTRSSARNSLAMPKLTIG